MCVLSLVSCDSVVAFAAVVGNDDLSILLQGKLYERSMTHYNFFNNIFLWNSLCVLYSTATSVSFQWVLLILCYINALHFIHHPAQVIVGDSSVRNTSSFTHVSIIAYSTIMLLQFGADGNRNQKSSRNVWLTPTVWGRRLTWMCDYYFIFFCLVWHRRRHW